MADSSFGVVGLLVTVHDVTKSPCSKVTVSSRYDMQIAAVEVHCMWTERGLRVVLVLVGLFFSAAIIPLIGGLRYPAHSDTGDTMMMSLYFALGIFLLIAVPNPSAHRSVIAFAAWSSFAHAVTMSVQGLEIPSERIGFLVGSGVLVLVGVVLLALAPPRPLAHPSRRM